MGYTDDRRAHPPESDCLSCRRNTDLKVKAEVLQRFIIGAMAPPPTPDQPVLELTPAQREASTWNLAISACLRREMAPHPKCESCGILMGPGHIEVGIAPLCRTCGQRHPNGKVSNLVPVDQAFAGRRGWFSDHVARQNH